MARVLRCPMDAVALPSGATHCPRCGARVAALPSRRRPRSVPTVIVRRPLTSGAAVGVILGWATVLAVGLVHLLGGVPMGAAGDAEVAIAFLLVMAGAFGGGPRLRRWEAAPELMARHRDHERLGPIRTALLAAAVAPATTAVLLALAGAR